MKTELFDNANWIGAFMGLTENSPVRPAPFFRKVFFLEQLPEKAEVYFCGLGYSELYLNGKKVDECVLQPVVNQYDKRTGYLRYDVTGLLQKGENVFGAVLGNGWYNCCVADTWHFEKAPWREYPKMILDFYCDGEQKVVSDPTWKCLPKSGPIRYDALRSGEVYDARNDISGWNDCGFDDSGWTAAHVVDAPPGVMTEQTMPGCKVTRRLDPVSATKGYPSGTVYDFGQNITGWAGLKVKGVAGSKITILYSEHASDMKNVINRSNIDAYLSKDERFQTDEYILSGNGIETWEPRFTYHGFRYAKIDVEGDAELLEVKGCVLHTDFEFLTVFESSSPILNQLHKMTHWSFIDNYTGIPTDCPHREKNGWTGDACLASDFGFFHYDIESSYYHWIRLMADSQRPSGQFSGIAPTNGWGYNWGNGPLYDTTIIQIPWNAYRYTGKTRMLEDFYDNMKKCILYIKRMSYHHIVSYGLGDWCPVDWSRMTAISLTGTGYYYGNTVLLSRIAAILGKEEDSIRFKELSEEIRDAFQKEFYCGNGIYSGKENGVVREDDVTAIGTALYWGICPESERAAAAARLNEAVLANRCRADFGMFGAKIVTRALAENGYTATAYRMITQPEYPGWVDWINHGATTIWENWKGELSQTHIAYGDISAWMIQYLGGIMPSDTAPGFSALTIKPFVPSDLEFLKVSSRLASGTVVVDWKQENGKFRLDLTIPEGVPCRVILPDGTEFDQTSVSSHYECDLK